MSYSPVRISVLRGDQKIGFDVYIEIGSKYILYLRKGESFEGARLQRLKDKKLKKMFIRESDENLYRAYVERNIEMAYDKGSGQTIENRTQVVQGVQQAAAEAVFENPADEAAYQAAKIGSERFTNFLLAEDKAIKQLLALENTDQSLAHHGVSVASLAVEIAKVTGYADKKNLPHMALGGLLHDLGHVLSGQNISRPLSAFRPEELALYKQHPTDGAKKLKDLKHMDLHVTQIILQHEEAPDGSGFPDKLKEAKMNPIALYVQTANAFDRLIAFEGLSHAEALKKVFTVDYLGRYPLPHLNAIKSIMNRPS